MAIYALRHLVTAKNRAGVFIGNENEPILPNQTLDLRGHILADTLIIGYSTLMRCRQTVGSVLSIVATNRDSDQNIYLKPVNELVERNLGEWQGKPKSLILAQYGNKVTNGILDPLINPPNGESYAAFRERVWKAASELLALESAGTDVIICTHVHVLRIIAAIRRDIEPSEVWHTTTFPHGVLTLL